MSVSKLEKYLQVPIVPNGVLKYKPIILADSKGRYINCHSDILSQFGPSFSAKFIYNGGARLADYFPWLQYNMPGEIKRQGRIVYIYTYG